jgi:hypothetical protein
MLKDDPSRQSIAQSGHDIAFDIVFVSNGTQNKNTKSIISGFQFAHE